MTTVLDQGNDGFDEAYANLELIKPGEWATLYRHRGTGELWDLTFPQSHLHGGGPMRLRKLDHNDPDAWVPYPG